MGIDKRTMVDADFWRQLWAYAEQMGGIRAIRFGTGVEWVFDRPIGRESFPVPEDFPSSRTDGGCTYVFGVQDEASARPGATGEATGALPYYRGPISVEQMDHPGDYGGPPIPGVEYPHSPEDNTAPAIVRGRGYMTFEERESRKRYDDE